MMNIEKIKKWIWKYFVDIIIILVILLLFLQAREYREAYKVCLEEKENGFKIIDTSFYESQNINIILPNESYYIP